MTDSLIPGEPTLDQALAARERRLAQAQQFMAHGWPDGTPAESAGLFERIQTWIAEGGPRPPWEPEPEAAPHPYPPAPATTEDRPL